MGININTKVDNHLKDYCKNNDSNICENAINEADIYIKRVDEVLDKYYKSSIEGKDTINKFRTNLEKTSNNKNLDLIKSPSNNNKCDNLDSSPCTNNILCQWDSRTDACKPNMSLCQNIDNKADCPAKCKWENNKCNNINKIESRHNPLNNKDNICIPTDPAVAPKKYCKNTPGCSWNNNTDKCVNLRQSIYNR